MISQPLYTLLANCRLNNTKVDLEKNYTTNIRRTLYCIAGHNVDPNDIYELLTEFDDVIDDQRS